MAMMDVFNGKEFSMTSLTNMVNKMPYVPNRTQSLGLVSAEGVRTETVAMEKKEGKLSLIQTSERGDPLTQGTPNKGDIRDFRSVRLAKGDTITAREIQGIRAEGSETELKQVQAEVSERMAQLMIDYNLTMENMLLGMVQGIVLDADDSVIYNWFDEWGIAQAPEISWNFAGATLGDFRKKVNELQRRMARNTKGAVWGGKIHAYCGDNWFDALTTHPEIEKIYLNQSEASDLKSSATGTAFSAFRFGPITFENYRGTDDNSEVAVDADSVKFFPVGGRGIFFDKRSPGESMSMVNRKGKSLYSMLVRDRDRDMWVQPEIYSYPLLGCLRPEMLERGTV